jgi:hypothetical protein
MKCVHGIDNRFCAVCNRASAKTPKTPSRVAASDVSLDEILRFLNDEQVRATYGAVAEVLGLMPIAVSGDRLGPRRPEASWIVSAENGLPTGYNQDEWHPALLAKADIISSGRVLVLRLASWRAAQKS